jgi:hypothetical protein
VHDQSRDDDRPIRVDRVVVDQVTATQPLINNLWILGVYSLAQKPQQIVIKVRADAKDATEQCSGVTAAHLCKSS